MRAARHNLHCYDRSPTMILDHMTISVTDFTRSKAFYQQALAPLGITLIAEFDGYAGMGKDRRPQFWFAAGDVGRHRTHIAFSASSRAQVDAFYHAALAAGGTDNGAPGLREIYHPTYYGAFVLDPDGYNVEAVCHTG
jgi:catechol 2,3-dioxygenase-like lactoylglutathione lyase family enzyme